MTAISFALGLRELLQRQRPGIYARSSFRDAQLPADLCADRFGGATTAVTGYTKNSSFSAGDRTDLHRRDFSHEFDRGRFQALINSNGASPKSFSWSNFPP